MTERDEALQLARNLLDEPNADPDDALRMLSRQLLRTNDIVKRQEKALQDVDWDGKAELDLINANRDQILKMHEEAARLIGAKLRWMTANGYQNSYDEWILKVLDALNTYHPMHCESWCGWPKGSE